MVLLWIVYFPSMPHSISLRFICWDWLTAALAKQLFNSVMRHLLPSLTSLNYRVVLPSCCKSCWSFLSHTASLKWDKLKPSCMLGLETAACFTACCFVQSKLTGFLSLARRFNQTTPPSSAKAARRSSPRDRGVINVLCGRHSVWPRRGYFG